MKLVQVIPALAVLGILSHGVQAQQTMENALTVTFENPAGEQIGIAMLVDGGNGVIIELNAQSLPPGEHGFHIHEKADCTPPETFENAGGHYNPSGAEHGFFAEGGPHAGDLANIHVQRDGSIKTERFNALVSLEAEPRDGRFTLFDEDGSALVIHSGMDDYHSQPSGNAGGRLACAEIRR